MSILNNYIIPNEGWYINDENDSGGETNMGISKNTYKSEDIKKLERRVKREEKKLAEQSGKLTNE